MTEINVTNKSNENKKLKKSTLFLILFFISNIIFPGWSLYPLIHALSTVGIALRFGFAAFIAFVFSMVFYKKCKKTGKFKKCFIVSTIVSICCVIIIFVCPFICLNFENSQAMYPIKKWVYSMGVCSESMEYYPSSLPEKCEDYYFKTEDTIKNTDYNECSYLSFYTDKDSIAVLEEKCKEKGGYSTIAEITFDKYIESMGLTESELNDKELMLSHKRNYLKNLKFPRGVYNQLNEEKLNELDESLVVYSLPHHGYAFDYDSGLVVVWG